MRGEGWALCGCGVCWGVGVGFGGRAFWISQECEESEVVMRVRSVTRSPHPQKTLRGPVLQTDGPRAPLGNFQECWECPGVKSVQQSRGRERARDRDRDIERQREARREKTHTKR